MSKTLNTIRLIVAEQLNYVTIDDVQPESKLADLGADSLDLVEIVMTIKSDFGIDIPDEDWERVVTVQDAVNLVDAALVKVRI